MIFQDSFDSGEGGTTTGDDGGSSSGGCGGGGGLASALQSEIRRRAEKNAGMLNSIIYVTFYYKIKSIKGILVIFFIEKLFQNYKIF